MPLRHNCNPRNSERDGPLDISVRVRVYGRVQGVCFRAWTVREAEVRGLSGWVRNRTDGSVEAMFAGDAPMVRQMVERCSVGPPSARVERVEETQGTETVPSGFVQRRTC